MFIERLAFVLTVALRLFSLWFLATALFFWRKAPRYPRCVPCTSFACVIPARNEEAVVAALVKSLNDQDYPPAMYDVFVIPNNCTDATEDAAAAAGANILRCLEPVRCKGDVLRQAAVQLLPRGYDAICVFDADNLVRRDFLARMNDAVCAGAGVAKGQIAAKNPYQSWVSGCTALYYGLSERFYNRSHAALGLSPKLVGTGFAVTRDVLRRMGGWNTVTIAEDAEFAAMCAGIGEKIWYVPEAVTFDEAPASLSVSVTQRRRWSSGIMASAGVMLPRLAAPGAGANALRKIDSALLLSAPFMQALSVIPALLLIISAAAGGTLLPWAAAAGITLAVTYAAAAVFGAVIAAVCGLDLRRMIKAALLFPVYTATWLPIHISCLIRRAAEWKEIRHTGVMDAVERFAREESGIE